MAVDLLLLVGLAVAVFVGFNIGGSSTGVSFGPAVGSGVVTKLAAAVLMSVFAMLGGLTVGRNVIATMGGKIVPRDQFTLAASVAVLFFIGLALLVSNVFGVPASTSMTAVGAIAGLGVATSTLDWTVMGQIVTWWLVAPILAFWVCAVIGRYLYPHLDRRLRLGRIEGPPVVLDRSGAVPTPTLSDSTGTREALSAALVVVIGCYMAFSAGASNVANAVAPLVGNGAIEETPAILVGGGAIGLGAFTIARRTLDTVGNDLTDLPLLAALIVETVSASLIAFLSYIGVPASLAVSATMCIVGLGWGRATRVRTIPEAATAAMRHAEHPESATPRSASTTETDYPETEVPPIGQDQPRELVGSDLFDPAATGRVFVLWVLTPTISAVASYLLFRFAAL
ncbi:MAG: anion permease [Halobacteriaceae archaeon]